MESALTLTIQAILDIGKNCSYKSFRMIKCYNVYIFYDDLTVIQSEAMHFNHILT